MLLLRLTYPLLRACSVVVPSAMTDRGLKDPLNSNFAHLAMFVKAVGWLVVVS